MSLLQVCLFALMTLLVLHAGVMPTLRKRLESDRSPAVIGPLTWYRMCAVLRTSALVLLISTALLGAVIWWLSHLGTDSVESVTGMLQQLRRLQEWTGAVDLGFTAFVFVVLAAGLLWLTYKQSRQRASALFTEIEASEWNRVVDDFKAERWEELAPTELMTKLSAAIDERQLTLQKHREQNDTARVEELEAEIEQLRQFYFNVDARRRMVVEAPEPFANDLVLPPGSGWVERLRQAFFNRGVLQSMSAGARLIALLGLALLIPASASLSLGLGQEPIEAHVVRLEEVRISLGRDNAEQALQQALKSSTVSTRPPAALSDDEAEEALAETYDRNFSASVVARATTSALRARIAQAAMRDQILQQYARGSPEVSVLRDADDVHVSQELESPRQRMRERIRAIRRENAAAWEAIKHALPQRAAFATQAARADLYRAMSGELYRTAFSAPAVELGAAYEAHASHYMAELARGGDLDAARTSAFDKHGGHYWTTGTQVNLASMQQHMDGEGHPLDRALRDRPPTLHASPHSTAQIEAAQRILADMPASHRSAQALYGFSDLAPGHLGDELRTPAGRTAARLEPRTTGSSTTHASSSTAFQRSRSYASLRGFSRVGGVLIGRPPESDKSQADVVDIGWEHPTVDRILLILKARDGNVHRFGPYSNTLVLQGLTYAADQRPLAVTMITATPVPDLKIITHPALVDSAAGCHAVAIDRVADEATSRAAYRRHAEETVHGALAAYRLAWAAAMAPLVPKEFSGEEQRVVARVVERTQAEGWRELLPVYAQVRAALNNDAALPLKAKPEFYDGKLVKQLIACADAQSTVDGLGNCLRTQATGHTADALMKRLPEFQIWSGVREVPYSIDSKLDFLRPSGSASRELWPFDFVLQTAFTRQGLIGDQEVVDMQPWEFPLVHDRLVADVVQLLRTNAQRRTVLAVMRDFTVVQRLFRAALAGQLGEDFPLQKLGNLSRELNARRGMRATFKTPRWNLRPMEAMYAQSFGQMTKEASPALQPLMQSTVRALTVCVASGGADAAGCRFDGLKQQAANFRAESGTAADAALARELHGALGVLELRRVLGVHQPENRAGDMCPMP